MPSTRSSQLLRAVSTITGIDRPAWRQRFNTVRPSIWGKPRSRTTAEKSSVSPRYQASPPSRASETWNPLFSSQVLRLSATPASSSTTRIFIAAASFGGIAPATLAAGAFISILTARGAVTAVHAATVASAARPLRAAEGGAVEKTDPSVGVQDLEDVSSVLQLDVENLALGPGLAHDRIQRRNLPTAPGTIP